MGKIQPLMEPTMTEAEIAEVKRLEKGDWLENYYFWAGIHNRSTGVDRIKSLVSHFLILRCIFIRFSTDFNHIRSFQKNMCVVMMKAKVDGCME